MAKKILFTRFEILALVFSAILFDCCINAFGDDDADDIAPPLSSPIEVADNTIVVIRAKNENIIVLSIMPDPLFSIQRVIVNLWKFESLAHMNTALSDNGLERFGSSLDLPPGTTCDTRVLDFENNPLIMRYNHDGTYFQLRDLTEKKKKMYLDLSYFREYSFAKIGEKGNLVLREFNRIPRN